MNAKFRGNRNDSGTTNTSRINALNKAVLTGSSPEATGRVLFWGAGGPLPGRPHHLEYTLCWITCKNNEARESDPYRRWIGKLCIEDQGREDKCILGPLPWTHGFKQSEEHGAMIA
jgi:hypothetical protein